MNRLRWPASVVIPLSMLIAACSGTPSPSTAVATDPPPSAAATNPASVAPTPAATASTFDVLPGEPWLLYAWFPDRLYLVRPDGSDRQPIDLAAGGVPGFPTWSPDGERIAFVMKNSATPNGSIWTANVDGSSAALLYDGNGDCGDGAFWPSWSPDGSRLALVCYYVNDKGGFSDISVLDVASMKRTALATLRYPETVDNPISWSPDGTMLAFERIRWDASDQFVEQSMIATVPAAGGKVRNLTDPTLFGAHPDWSPDGTLIAFNTYDTGNIHGTPHPSNVYVVAPDGTGLRQLSTASVGGTMRIGQPFWSADGARIWVSIARDFDRDSNGQFMNLLGWVDAASGELHVIGTEGKRFRERPAN